MYRPQNRDEEVSPSDRIILAFSSGLPHRVRIASMYYTSTSSTQTHIVAVSVGDWAILKSSVMLRHKAVRNVASPMKN